VLFVLRYTDSDYPFGIFKLFLPWCPEVLCVSMVTISECSNGPGIILAAQTYLGPRSVLCVVVVTISECSNGPGIISAATSPDICDMSANIIAFY
jgi:hypothetical protein